MFSPILALLASVNAFPVSKRDVASIPGFDYQNDKLRGVNLGGWFILEPYMNPSFFSDGWDPANIPVDEYHWTLYKGKDQASEILNNHWDTWIQESDFEQMASWGINFVRIPIGYWAFFNRPQDPYVQGQIQYLDRALDWAREYGIKVWIDLHGVPGSQNGFDNSGLRDQIDFQQGSNSDDALTAFDGIVERYAGPDFYDVVIGIEPVNEPLGPALDMDKLHQYYDLTYGKVRNYGWQGVVLHDAFQGFGYFNSWADTPEEYNVVIDHHCYQVFSVGELQRDIDDHIGFACNIGRQLSTIENKWRVVGEWSAALTDCAPLLNGVYRGARYDGTYENDYALGSCAGINDLGSWTDQKKIDTRKYVEAQLDAYEYGGSGWVFWAYKTENTVEWDLSRLIESGLFPNPVTERQYQNICGY